MVKVENVRWEKIFLLLWLVLNLSIGALTVHRYGMSIDEPNNYRYADDTLDAYPSFFGTLYEPNYDSSYDGHGPAFVTMANILIKGIQGVFPNVFAPDLWHFSYFITFQLTGLCLYWLTNRWFNKWTAWGIIILFTTQPLLWGHAFINPKDIPFMFFFTLSIVSGFCLVDSVGVNESSVSLENPTGTVTNEFREKRYTWKQQHKPAESVTDPGSLKIWFAEFFRALCNQHNILAGIALGLATAMRPVAPLAGVIVVLYLFLKVRSRAWTTAIAYFLIAGVGTYLAWPYLWKAPIASFLQSLKTTTSFPYRGSVLFMGNLYPTNQLPGRFFPTLLGLQLTEPALMLISIGFAVSCYLFIKGKNRESILLFAIWFLLPTLWIVFSRSALYDNARQLLFLWPALFILAGMGIDQLITLIKPSLVRVILVIALVSPGIYASIQLHPYQYIYYNSLIGGVRGAYGNFELDYWATSFRESMDYLNKNAGQGTQVVVIGPRPIARTYARADLKKRIIGIRDQINLNGVEYYYILFLGRAGGEEDLCLNAETVYEIKRDGGILSYIKKVNSEQKCW